MDLRHLETFLKIAELKSFTKAAEELYLTQPTVSKQVVDLERFFDVRLIDRTKRTVTLTRAGEILYRHAKDMAGLKKDTIEAIAAFKGLKTGTLTAGASTIPGIYILPHVLSAFKDRYSGIEIKLVIADTDEIVSKMEEGSLDIGIVGAKGKSHKVEYKRLIDDNLVMIGAPGFVDSIPLSDLEKYPLVMRERGSGTRNAFETALKRSKTGANLNLRVAAEVSDTEAIKEAVKAGMGVSYISKMAITNELASGTLKSFSVRGLPEIKRSFYLITRKGKTLLPQVKALLEIIDHWRKHEKS